MAVPKSVLLAWQMQSICQHDEMRLKSEKARMFITTPSSSASADSDEYGQLSNLRLFRARKN